MRLYTICPNGQPVLVISAGVEPPMEDCFTTNADLMKASRAMREMLEDNPDAQRISEVQELDEAIDTYLGMDLMAYGLWNGVDRADVQVRDASPDETHRWRAALQASIIEGEQDAGDEDFAVWLVTLPEETDE